MQESKLLLFVATERGLIHDDLGQALTAIKIVVSSLVLDWSEGRTFSERAESIINLIDPAIASVRKIATELRPAILNDLGLVAAVEWAAEEFKARTGTKCRLSLPANPVTPHFLIFAVIQRLIQARFADLRD